MRGRIVNVINLQSFKQLNCKVIKKLNFCYFEYEVMLFAMKMMKIWKKNNFLNISFIYFHHVIVFAVLLWQLVSRNLIILYRL